MYKHTWLTQAIGTARNQEIYEWLTANCSDLFDTITIDESQTRVSCNIGDSEVLGVSSTTTTYKDQIYWNGSGQFSTSSYSNNAGFIGGIYRITNGVLLDIMPYISGSVAYKYTPSIALIKHNNDIFFINISTYSDLTYKGYRYMTIGNNSSTYHYYIYSYNNGNGSQMSKTIPNYYAYFGNNAILTPMVCTNTAETPTEIIYWLKQSGNRNTGLITINGKEYFSNGIFCILNE